LSEISANHIAGELEKIEAFRSRGVIRITTGRVKADLIIQDVEQALKRIRRMRISLFDLAPLPENPKVADKRFDDATLLELSRLTNTDIVRQTQRNVWISHFRFLNI
jgi:Mitochondrial inner-membrane-bound regulator